MSKSMAFSRSSYWHLSIIWNMLLTTLWLVPCWTLLLSTLTFHFLLCLFLLPYFFFFSSPLSLMILLASSVTAFKIYLLVLKEMWLSPYSQEPPNQLKVFFLINRKSIVGSLISQTAGLFFCLKSSLPFCHFLSHTPPIISSSSRLFLSLVPAFSKSFSSKFRNLELPWQSSG